MGTFCLHCKRRGDDNGFTLVELVIALGVAAVAFLALSSMLAASLRSLAVQKARTQGNEVATQAIEDLQRYAFASLAVCGPPMGAEPAGLELEVRSTSSSCPIGPGSSGDSARAKFGDEPCNGSTSTGIPRAQYDCKRLNTTFKVRRYVAWTDAGRTSKRMAVFVSWRDLVGPHEVSQQSSLRSPTTGDIVGIDPPGFVASTATDPNPVLSTRTSTTAGGVLTAPVSVSVKTKGLNSASADRVFIRFTTVDGTGELQTSSVALIGGTPSADTPPIMTWTGSIPIAIDGIPLQFPEGSQYLTLTAVRDSDGKTGALVDSPASTFCPSGGCPGGLPTFTVNAAGSVAQSFSTVNIDTSGALVSSFELRAVTRDLASTDRVMAQLNTRAGAVSIGMTAIDDPADDSDCTATGCTWTATVSPSIGYNFEAATAAAYFTASRSGGAGSTGAAPSSPITFQVAP